MAGEETTWLLESILNVLFDTGGIGGGPLWDMAVAVFNPCECRLLAESWPG